MATFIEIDPSRPLESLLEAAGKTRANLATARGVAWETVNKQVHAGQRITVEMLEKSARSLGFAGIVIQAKK